MFEFKKFDWLKFQSSSDILKHMFLEKHLYYRCHQMPRILKKKHISPICRQARAAAAELGLDPAPKKEPKPSMCGAEAGARRVGKGGHHWDLYTTHISPLYIYI